MKPWNVARVVRWTAGAGAACALAIVVLGAYENPHHVVQWLELLQWCR